MRELVNASFMIVILACALVLLVSCDQAAAQEEQRMSQTELNELLRKHQKTHYINYEALACRVVYFIKPTKWLIRCSFTGDDVIMKPFKPTHNDVLG